jgi:DNA-binding transcriptional ArsR family regulator
MDPLKVIAVERRRQILKLIWHDELSAGDIAARFDVSWPAISQHLGVLKAAGFVTERRDGRSRLYRAKPEAMGHLRAVIESMWQTRLGDLKAVVEADLRNQEDS